MMSFGDKTNNQKEMSTSALTCTPGRCCSACAFFFGVHALHLLNSHCAFRLMCFSIIFLFDFRLSCFSIIFLFAYCACHFFFCGGRFKVVISPTWL
jgi:hypothetical protein